jgi:hypothetical protein
LHAAEEQQTRRINERLSVETRTFPYSKLKDPFSGTPHQRLEIQPENLRLRMGLPPLRFPKKNAMLIPSLTYEQVHFNYRNWNSQYEPYRVDTLHSIGASIFYRQPFQSPGWGFSLFLSGALASDFQSITTEDVRIQGGVLINRKVRGGNISFGAALIDNYGKQRVFPAIGFDPDVNAEHKFTLRVPVEVSYFYCPQGRSVEAGIAARVGGVNANLNEPGDYQHRNVAYSVGTVGPSVRLKFSKFVTLTVDGGWVPYHRFQILDKDDKLRDYDLSTDYFIAAGLRLSL